MSENTVIFERALQELEKIEEIGSEEWLKGWQRLDRQSRVQVLDSASDCARFLGGCPEITDDALADSLARITGATWTRLAQDWFGGMYQCYVIKPGHAPYVPEEIQREVYAAAFGPLPSEKIFGPFQTWVGGEGEQTH